MDNDKCPECGTRGYLVLPSYGNCKTCLALRIAFLEKRFPPEAKADPNAKRKSDAKA